MEKLDDKNSSQPSLYSKALESVSQFPILQALGGRRSRRFCMGAEIPDGPLSFKSNQEPFPLTDLEQILLLTSMAGSTGWHYTISFDVFTRPNFHLTVLDLLEEPFHLLLVFTYLTFSLQMIMGPTTFLHVTSTLHQRIIAESESN